MRKFSSEETLRGLATDKPLILLVVSWCFCHFLYLHRSGILDARVQRSILSMPTNTYVYFGNVANQKHEFRANVVLNQRSSWATWLVLRPKLASAHPTSSAKFPPTPKWSDFYPLGKKHFKTAWFLLPKGGYIARQS